MKISKNRGYVILLALMLISSAIIIITSGIYNIFNYNRTARLFFNNYQANNLILSYIDFVKSKISLIIEKENKKDIDKLKIEWIKNILKFINKWNNIKIENGKIKDLEIEAKFYISCQEGKININYLYNLFQSNKKEKDIKNQEVNNQNREKANQNKENRENNQQINNNSKNNKILDFFDKLIKEKTKVSIKDKFKNSNIYNNIIDDITQLEIDIPHFNNQTSSKNLDIYLKDLFSDEYKDEYKKNYKINPILFSKSLIKILFKNNKLKDEIDISKIEKKIKLEYNWQNDWDNILAEIYNIKFNQLDDNIKSILDNKLNINSFLVIISISYLKLKKDLAVVLSKNNGIQDDSNISKDSIIFEISKIYWL